MVLPCTSSPASLRPDCQIILAGYCPLGTKAGKGLLIWPSPQLLLICPTYHYDLTDILRIQLWGRLPLKDQDGKGLMHRIQAPASRTTP